MKRILLILGVLWVSLFETSGQIVDKKKTWNVMQTFKISRTKCYQFLSDTLIHDTTYTKLFYSYSEHFDPDNALYAGAIKENKGKVYIRFPSDEVFLLYDFTRQQCDTIDLGYLGLSSRVRMRVEWVETVMIDTVPHKRMFLTVLDGEERMEQVWMEGMGSNWGLIEVGELQQYNYNTKLLCVKEKGKLLWQSSLGVCYYSNAPDDQKVVIKTSPDPAKDIMKDRMEITLRNDLHIGETNLKLLIYNKEGDLVASRKIKRKKDLEFSNLASGEYLIQITDYFNKIYTVKKIRI